MGVCVPYPEGSVRQGCVKCGLADGCGRNLDSGAAVVQVGMRRDVEFERDVTRTAHQAAGLPVPAQVDGDPIPPTRLDWFAEGRCRPGSVDVEGRDLRVEALEELGDARNYLSWRCQTLRDGYDRGDNESCREYAMAMRGLQYVALAYDALTVPPT